MPHTRALTRRIVLCFLLLVAPAAAQDTCLHATLLASDGAEGDSFGHGLALCGDVAAIGAYGDKDFGYFTGAVYVFRHDGQGWVQEVKLLAPDAAQSDYFGVSVALARDVLVAGAVMQFPNFGGGKAHVYRFDGTAWRHEQRLAGSGAGPAARFGDSAAIDRNTIIVGSTEDYYLADTGAAYVFEYDPVEGVWNERAMLEASDGAGHDEFGDAVDISGEAAIVGAPQHDGLDADAGAAYIFRRGPDGGWVEEAKLEPDAHDGPDTRFGNSVAIDGATAVVGAPRALDDDGAVYVYRFDGAGWTRVAKLLGRGYRFGRTVALHGDLLLGSGRSDPDFGYEDAVKLFRSADGINWSHADTFTAPDLFAINEFGYDLALSGNSVLVGDWRDPGDDFSFDTGAAYLFGLGGCERCPADFDLSGGLNTLDVLAFLNAFVAAQSRADFDCDGSINTLDVLAFLNAFAAGC